MDLPLMPCRETMTSASSPFSPDHVEVGGRDLRVQLAAVGILHDRSDFLFLRRRAFEGDGSGDVGGGGDLQRRRQPADHN